MKSKTQQALDWLAKAPKTHTVTEAAERFGLTPQAIYAARSYRIKRKVCPCCNQVIKAGYTVKIPKQ